MNFRSALILFAAITFVRCEMQFCRFFNIDWTSAAGSFSRYTCRIDNVKLLNENETVITNINNSKTDIENVEAVQYYGESNNLTFIPNSLYKVFKNIQILSIHQAGLKILRPHFFENATKLTTLEISNNLVEYLEANLFLSAPNLQTLYLNMNNIVKIDLLTFSGLFQLTLIDLSDNRIKKLSPKTFSHLLNLQELLMQGNGWIDKNFVNASENFIVIEEEIDKNCEGLEPTEIVDSASSCIKIVHSGFLMLLTFLIRLSHLIIL